MLPNTSEEANFFNNVKKNYNKFVHPDCHFLFTDVGIQKNHKRFVDLILDVIDENDLNFEDMTYALTQIFSDSVPQTYKASFLEAERLKEESKIENSASLEFCYKKAIHNKLNCPLLIDIANPYDGFNRFHNVSILLAPFLAALGFPTLLHGCEEVAPKRGINPYKLLLSSQKNPLKSVDEVKSCLENQKISWGYLDQSLFFPELRNLSNLRSALVKRPVLTTIEKFLLPFYADQTYLVTDILIHPTAKNQLI